MESYQIILNFDNLSTQDLIIASQIEEYINNYNKCKSIYKPFVKNYKTNDSNFFLYLSACSNLPMDIINAYKFKLDFSLVVRKTKLPIEFLNENFDLIRSQASSGNICSHQKLNHEFIVKYLKYFSYVSLINHQKLSRETIEYMVFTYDNYKKSDKDFIFKQICMYQELSETFMRQYSNKLDWYYVSKFQKFSIRFAWLMRDKLQINYVKSNKKLSPRFINKYINLLKKYNKK